MDCLCHSNVTPQLALENPPALRYQQVIDTRKLTFLALIWRISGRKLSSNIQRKRIKSRYLQAHPRRGN